MVCVQVEGGRDAYKCNPAVGCAAIFLPCVRGLLKAFDELLTFVHLSV